MTARRAPARRRPDSLGSTEQLPSGRFRAYYSREGERFNAPHTFATRSEAQDWLAAERADRARGTWLDPRAGRITLTDYARELLDGRSDLAPATRRLYAWLLERYVLPALESSRGRRIELGRRYLADLTPADVRAWYAILRDEARRAALKQPAPSRPAAPTSPRKPEHPARLWAQRTGMPISASGRMPRAVLDAWRAAGSPASAPSRGRRLPVPPIEAHARAWARRRGLAVEPTGRLARSVLDAWRAAGSPIAPTPATAPRSEPDNAGQTTAAQAYRLLHSIMATAQRDALLTSNPCVLPGAGRDEHRPRGIATPAEVAALASHMPRRLAAAVHIAAWSGLRYGELFALARRHVDLDAGTLRVERAVQRYGPEGLTFGKTKTTGSRRTVHLPAFVAQLLADHMAENVADDPDALLFSTAAGNVVTNAHLAAAFRRARIAIDRLDLTWHDLRHTGATLAYRAGASVPEVQARLGHTTMRAASIYAHVADDSDRTLAESMDALYGDRSGDPRRHLRAV